MHGAALVFGVWEYFAHDLQHPHALVANDELHTVKATTTEHLGFEGREEGISVSAVALIYRPADGK